MPFDSAFRFHAGRNPLSLGFLLGLVYCLVLSPSFAQIETPQDAPRPLSPSDSAAQMQVPPGYRWQLVASEPIVREPSGVCWDERGRLYVCELHGYNLEGQYDIEALNETGELDRVVRRIAANDVAKQRAAEETYGTLKRLEDRDGDGVFETAQVLADRLPSCHGICAARGGLLIACQNSIEFVADRDDDGVAEERVTLFRGFASGPLERSLNSPQWGPDGWIYVGRGSGGGLIEGPNLASPVQLPSTDYRLRPDGSAIEPVVGGTHTMGFAFHPAGDRFVISTRTAGIQTAPFTWADLARNPLMQVTGLEHDTMQDVRCYPVSQPHPWRSRRAADPGFAKYYTDRYGTEESAPNGFFTSACSPLIYLDETLPELQGQLLACEPAQNFVHRGALRQDGVYYRLDRPELEKQGEFLASRDAWFHPISLAVAPDGTIIVVDFYREIIEDYSAIPRYLQQQYGLMNGASHGRIWKLVPDQAQAADTWQVNLGELSESQLVQELRDAHSWRRETARRLLQERGVNNELRSLIQEQARQQLSLPADESRPQLTAISILATHLHLLTEVQGWDVELWRRGMSHRWPEVRRVTLRALADNLDRDRHQANWDERLWEPLQALQNDPAAAVRLQLAVTLGRVPDRRKIAVLAQLARQDAELPWTATALLSSSADCTVDLLQELLGQPAELGSARPWLVPLIKTVAARGVVAEMALVLVQIEQLKDVELQAELLQSLLPPVGGSASEPLALPTEAQQQLLRWATQRESALLAQAAQQLRVAWQLESPEERGERVQGLLKTLRDWQEPVESRLSALADLRRDRQSELAGELVASAAVSTPQVRAAIWQELMTRRESLPVVLDALEQGQLTPGELSAVQRKTLLEQLPESLAERARKTLGETPAVNAELAASYVAALQQPADRRRGGTLFREKCGGCHAAHYVGTAVGPDLSAEFRRAPETIVQDVLEPSRSIAAGYHTHVVTSVDGRIFTGILAAESASSVTIKQAEGKTETLLRRDIEDLRVSGLSMMPEELSKTVSPRDLADIIGWLRNPVRERRVLYNFDGDSCFWTKAGSQGPAAITEDDVKQLIAEICFPGSRVDTVLVCVNAQVMYYPTSHGTMRGAVSTAEEKAKWPASERQRFANLERFFAAGVDPYEVLLAEAKRSGREALLTFRMNDDHGNDFLRTQFWIDHPQCRLGSGALDFGQPMVRAYVTQLILEAVERYDCDGIELDFNRFPRFFQSGTTAERCAWMNELVRDVRAGVDQIGQSRRRRLVVSVRVPSNFGTTPPSPTSAQELGCDVAEWESQGWIDFVTVSEFLFTRYDLPIRPWKELLQSVPVYGGIECTEGGDKQQYLTPAKYERAAQQLRQDGADGVYLFNFFTTREYGAEAWEPPFDVLGRL